jgi:hypothetical protein
MRIMPRENSVNENHAKGKQREQYAAFNEDKVRGQDIDI